MRTPFLPTLILLAATASAQTTTGWQLVWSDEFNGPAGGPPNPTNWNYDLGAGGWGNGEAETYTNSTQNAYQDGNGNLVISAIRSSSGAYTSARLQTGSPGASTHTADLSWQYGLVTARIKLPYGQGVWPAFWMLGESYGSVGWPACGELDIMENFGTFNNNINVKRNRAWPSRQWQQQRLQRRRPVHAAVRAAGRFRLPPLRDPVVGQFGGFLCRWQLVLYSRAVLGPARAMGFQQSLLHPSQRGHRR